MKATFDFPRSRQLFNFESVFGLGAMVWENSLHPSRDFGKVHVSVRHAVEPWYCCATSLSATTAGLFLEDGYHAVSCAAILRWLLAYTAMF
jgi:hypothetical protein